METHISGIVRVDAVRLANLQGSQRVTWANLLPGCTGSPTVTVARAVFEGTVLNQFGIETAIC